MPARSDNLLDSDAPPLPYRSPAVEEEEDDGEYEVLVEPPPPAPAGLSQSVAPGLDPFTIVTVLILTSSGDDDYEDLSGGQRAVAIYDYQGGAQETLFFIHPSIILQGPTLYSCFPHSEADDEISFNPDEIITDIEMIDEGWWKGQCRGRVGLFPRAYVQLL